MFWFVLFYSVYFCFVLFYFSLFCFVLFYSVLFYAILFLICSVLFCFVLFYFVLFYSVYLSYCILFCLSILFYPVVFPTLFCSLLFLEASRVVTWFVCFSSNDEHHSFAPFPHFFCRSEWSKPSPPFPVASVWYTFTISFHPYLLFLLNICSSQNTPAQHILTWPGCGWSIEPLLLYLAPPNPPTH